jgi:preprotein translocase subunit YajC
VFVSFSHLLGASSGSSGSSGLSFLLLFALMGGGLYMLMIRPQQRRMRAQRELINSLGVGDEVVTIGGMFGTITALDDESVTVEVAPGVPIKFARGAISRKMVYDEPGSGVPMDDAIDDSAEGEPGSDEDSSTGSSESRPGPFGRPQRRKRGGAGTSS